MSKKTFLAGVNGLNAYIHKTDDVYFMYVTIDGTEVKEEQLIFKRKKDALAMFDKLNARIQGVNSNDS